MQKSLKPMASLDWFLLIILSTLWGGAFFFSKVALDALPPFMVVMIRVSIAAMMLHGIVLLMGHRMPTSPKLWASFFMMGLLNNLIPFSLIFWGQTQIASSLASIINATTPVWTVIFAHFLTRDEHFTASKIGGVLFGLFGVGVMIGMDALQSMGGSVFAQLAIVGAAMSYAFAGIYGKRFKGIPPIVTATGQITGTTIMMIPVVLIIDKPWTLPMPGVTIWLALAALALLSTFLAYVIYFRLLAKVGATNVLLVTLLVPVSATLLGVIILGEQLALQHLAGMGLIGLGLLVIDGRIIKAVRGIQSKPSYEHYAASK